MRPSIPFFKTINDNDDEILSKLGFSATDFEFSYTLNGKSIGLNYETKQDALVISDKDSQWDIEKNGLNLCCDVFLKNPKELFGENGVSGASSILGIGAICQSMISDRLEAFPVCSLTSDSDEITVHHVIRLSPGTYRSNLAVRMVLYLVDPGSNHAPYPTRSGTILGELKTTVLTLYEISSLFPIYDVEEPGEPLWWVKCQISDIETDSFTEENIAIVINKSSKYYAQLNKTDEATYNPALLAEIISSSICVILERIRSNKSDWEKIQSDSTYPTGTIAFVIQYIYNTLGFDFETQESLAASVRKYVYKKLGAL